MRVAIVHEWFDGYAGSERVVEQILNLFPEADLFAIVDFTKPGKRDFIQNKPVTTSFIQKMPFARSKFRNYLPLMPFAVEQFDLSAYDLIISSNHAVSKGIITGPNQLHICYCHSPIRYAWDLQHQYLQQAGLTKGFKSLIARLSLHKMRIWDYQSGTRADKFIANSRFIASRIQKIYRRSAEVIYPPVDVESFALQEHKKDFYLTAGRMVPYKRTDIIVEAFARMPDKKLVVIGEGSEYKRVVAKANGASNIEFWGHVPFETLKQAMQDAKAFVFAAEEDFGIAPVEAQACGTPVIGYGRGGVLESVCDVYHAQPTGLFFERQTADSVQEAVERFERNPNFFLPAACRENALRFSHGRFHQEFRLLVESTYQAFLSGRSFSIPSTVDSKDDTLSDNKAA